MAIIIPMAGLSNRFSNAGFSLPKYMLYIGNKSVFSLSIESFRNYFNKEQIIFICRNVYNTIEFIESECKILGLNMYNVVVLDQVTKGQAETVKIGIDKLNLPDSTPITIFNIDTFRKNYIKPFDIEKFDGYLEVFEGEGSNWSYVKENKEVSNLVAETAEKVQISNLCSNGLYYFKNLQIFNKAYLKSLNDQSISKSEIYIAPLYNHLIHLGYKIYFQKINLTNDLIFCGTPAEYLEQVSHYKIISK